MASTKQILHFSGRLTLKVRITDVDGDSTVQTGTAWGDDVKSQLDILKDHAVYSAIYKHYSALGYQGFKGDTYNVEDLTRQVQILDYYVDYGKDAQILTTKRVNYKGRYFQYLYNDRGKVVRRYKYHNKRNVEEDYYSSSVT